MVGATSHGMREGREGAARHRIAISTSEHASPRPKAPVSGRKSTFWALAGEQVATDADRDVSYGEREVADRMNVALGIGSGREPRGAAPLSQARHASRRSGRGLGRRLRPFRTHADVEIAG